MEEQQAVITFESSMERYKEKELVYLKSPLSGGDITDIIDQQHAEIKHLVLDYESKKLIAQAREQYINVLQDEYRTLSDSIEEIRKKILRLLDISGITNLDTPVGKVSIRAGQWRVAGDSIDNLPLSCKRIKTTVEADKIAIKQHLTDGYVIDGWELERGESTLVIKR